MSHEPVARLSIATQSRSQLIDVTEQIQKLLQQHRVAEGYAIICIPHTTAAITINENADPDVKSDLLKKLELLIPRNEQYYQHAEGNSDSHLKTSLVGSSVTVLIDGGQLLLGRWQGVYFCEFDGPREREMLVKIVNTRPMQRS